MNRKIELLAPGGDIDAIKAAIVAGADAIYCGLDKFNARNRAANITISQLPGILRLAHRNKCKVFITLNIVIIDSEIPDLVKMLNKLVVTSVDGIIVQDLGLLYLLSQYFPALKIHASTQLTTHNIGQILFLSKLNAERVNLSRELSIKEIDVLTKLGKQNNVATEVFVHGSNCLSFSGACYMSSVLSGNSGNRGRCSQPCRDQYITTVAGKKYPLNLKDLSAFCDVEELANTGVVSFKIEGRIKKPDYVYSVVKSWREQLDRYEQNRKLSNDKSSFYKVFNRDFSNAFLKGTINKNMFIDDPRDHSIKHLYNVNRFSCEDEKEKAALALYSEKDSLKEYVKSGIANLSTEKLPVNIDVVGKNGAPLKFNVKTPDDYFEIISTSVTTETKKDSLTQKDILKRLKTIDETGFKINNLNFDGLESGLFLPFKELTSLKKRLLHILMGSGDMIDPVVIPPLPKNPTENIIPSLSVLISSPDQIVQCEQSNADIYYQLPTSILKERASLQNLFNHNKQLIPWFPSIIIGDDYNTAVDFMTEINPKIIVTNNTGIGMEAYKNGIPWIAGPYMNLVNSYSLVNLKENFGCVGAFISNEINQWQLKRIRKPNNFKLYYSIFHPILLMTARQCLFQQISGCYKNEIDKKCIAECEKTAAITNLKNDVFFIEKTKGNMNHIFYEKHFLNTEIVVDIKNLFSGFIVDLRNIKTQTHINRPIPEIIKLFNDLIHRKNDAQKQIHGCIYPTTNQSYLRGI